ncbi:MAG: DUF2062 domain-containing protein [Gammaproteobacteria bacterium]|jgi:uncharacterized protein (DUF2062 family)
MSRKFIKKYLPEPHQIRDRWFLRPFKAVLQDPALWHINRRGTAKAFAIGIFFGFMPVPFQMALAAFAAVGFRVNIAVAVATVWFTNPLTMGPIFYSAYKVGCLLLQRPPLEFHFELSWDWLFSQLERVGGPLWLGSVVLGLIFGLLGYFALNLLWQRSLMRRYRRRRTFRRSEPENR